MTREEILGMEAGLALDNLVELHVFNHTKSMYLQAGPYSTDIKAAWEVREWITESIGGVRIINVCDELPEYCDIWNGKEYIKAQGKTVPEAICKAALLAVMEEKAEVEG
jgi:hypothetical protein